MQGQKFSGLTYKSRAKLKMLRGIRVYSAIYSEVNVSVSGSYVLQYAGGTLPSSCFISVTLKSWSGRKLFDPTTYMITTNVTRSVPVCVRGGGVPNHKTKRIFQKNLKETEGNLAVYVMCNSVCRVVQRIMCFCVLI
jgi:hypothetical protein